MPRINNQGVNIHYKVEGVGPPLLMLHGALGDSKFWFDSGYVEGLRKSYQLILVDLRGHGDSDKPYDSGSYSVNLFVQDVIAVLDELEIGVCHALGVSFGGWIVYSLWRKHPERTKSMILLDGVPGPDDSALMLKYSDKIEELASSIPQLTPAQKKRFLSNDKLVLQSLARGVADDIPRIIEDINKLPENMNLDSLILTSDLDGLSGIELALMKKIECSVSDGSLISLAGLSHFDLSLRSDKTTPHIFHFLNAQAE